MLGESTFITGGAGMYQEEEQKRQIPPPTVLEEGFLDNTYKEVEPIIANLMEKGKGGDTARHFNAAHDIGDLKL